MLTDTVSAVPNWVALTPEGTKKSARRISTKAPWMRSEIGLAGNVDSQSNAELNRWLTAALTAWPIVGAVAPQQAAHTDPLPIAVAAAIGPTALGDGDAETCADAAGPALAAHRPTAGAAPSGTGGRA